MTTVFVSYSTSDLEFVCERLAPRLERAGMKAWCSQSQLREGQNWEREIRSALEKCDWFVVVLSAHAQRSQWVQAETHWAMENMAGRVVPVLIDECKPTDVHLLLGTLQGVDLRVDQEQGFERLIAHMTENLTARFINTPSRTQAQEAIMVTAPTQRPRCARLELRIEGEGSDGAERERRLYVLNRAVIGRTAEVQLRIADPSVSRRHACIDVVRTPEGVSLTLLDLNSSNGTLLNGTLVQAARPIAPGDLISFGDVDVRVVEIDEG